jgi:hypothetical protein
VNMDDLGRKELELRRRNEEIDAKTKQTYKEASFMC